jgi:glutamine cyclotransferase
VCCALWIPAEVKSLSNAERSVTFVAPRPVRLAHLNQGRSQNRLLITGKSYSRVFLVPL